MHRLQGRLSSHIVICGFGTVGRLAAAELVRQGRSAAGIVVVDSNKATADYAASLGHTTLHGSATREEILEVAGVARADAVMICLDSDEAAALVVLTAREIGGCRIIVKVNEEENRKLMRRSGADQVLTLGALGGSLMADSVRSDLAAEFVSDLVSRNGQVHLVQRQPHIEEVGKPAGSVAGLVMIRRGGQMPVCGAALQAISVESGDQMLCMRYT
jgi:voltage-gated potassium channel